MLRKSLHLTIKGAVLRFDPLFQGFVKCTSVVRGRFIEISSMLADPEGFTGNPEFMEMLGDEVVRCSVFLPCCAQRLKSIPVAMVGDLTIKGAVLCFDPLFQGFVKCTSVVRGRFIEISSRLAKEVLTPQDGNDATAAVEEYMYDWWKFKTQYTHIQQFEDAFQFHVGKVGRSNLHLIPC